MSAPQVSVRRLRWLVNRLCEAVRRLQPFQSALITKWTVAGGGAWKEPLYDPNNCFTLLLHQYRVTSNICQNIITHVQPRTHVHVSYYAQIFKKCLLKRLLICSKGSKFHNFRATTTFLSQLDLRRDFGWNADSRKHGRTIKWHLNPHLMHLNFWRLFQNVFLIT